MPDAGDIIRASDHPGAVDRAENTADVTLSTTAGTFSDLVEGTAFTPISGRRYLVHGWFLGNLLIAGSGFATSDSWSYKVQVQIGAAAYADVLTSTYLVRAQVAQSMRYAVPPLLADYVAGSTSTLRFKIAATKGTGASTVTSVFETNNYLLVLDVG